jgi:hypothetical protein
LRLLCHGEHEQVEITGITQGEPVAGELAHSKAIDPVAPPASAEWGRVLGQLKAEVGEAAYRSWLRAMTIERVEGGEAVLAVPTRFLRNWIATH